MPHGTVMRCRFCGSGDGEVVLDLGRQPYWGAMPRREVPLPDPVFELQMWFCRDCSLAQLLRDAAGAPELLVVEPRAVAEQSDRAIGRLCAEGLVRPGSTVVEFGSPHGESWLPRLAAQDMVPVSPSGADQAGADMVVDFYGLLHEPDQASAVRSRAAALAPGGTMVLQMLSLAAVLADRQWFDLRHGHYAYWSLPALDDALRRHGLGVHRAWWYPMAGGTVLATACRDPEPDADTLRLIAAERADGVLDPSALRDLQDAADGAYALRDWLIGERMAGRTVAGYCAASRAVPLVCHAGLDAGLLAMVGDAAPVKQGRRMPGTDIPIVSPKELVAARPDRVLLFLPELAAEVRETVPGIEASGGRWIPLDDRLLSGEDTCAVGWGSSRPR